MKRYLKIISICSFILLFFPFVALPEFWEYLFVVIPAFIITYSSLRIFRDPEIAIFEDGDATQEYIKKLQSRFRTEKKKHAPYSYEE